MICKLLYKSIEEDDGKLENVMYNYGYCCGKTNTLDLNKVLDTLRELGFNPMDISICTKNILRGFCHGL